MRYDDYAGQLRAARAARVWSLRRAADAIGCAHQSIFEIEHGEWLPTDGLNDAIAAAYGYSSIQLGSQLRAARQTRAYSRAGVPHD